MHEYVQKNYRKSRAVRLQRSGVRGKIDGTKIIKMTNLSLTRNFQECHKYRPRVMNLSAAANFFSLVPSLTRSLVLLLV